MARLGHSGACCVVVRLRNAGYSLRKLAKIAGCTEGTIRNYEILGRVPPEAKQILYDGRVSMRRLVQLAREAQKRHKSEA